MEQGWMGRATAEFVGTFGLVFFGAGSIVIDHHLGADGYGLIGIALAHAIALAVLVTATMNISGGHLNPAISLSAFLTRKLSAKLTAVYVVAQVAGGLAGAAFVRALLPLASGEATAFGTPLIDAGLPALKAISLELLLTFFLVLTFWATILSERRPHVGGFAVGLVLFTATLLGSPLTGASLNPARALGPTLVAGAWSLHWVHWIAPVLGGALAAAVYEGVIDKGDPADAPDAA